jgi:2-dehydro-3-deoxygluconokinase
MQRDPRWMAPAPALRSFDVVCIGEARWNLAGSHGRGRRPAKAGPRLLPGGGAINTAVAVARQGLRVGLVTALTDDTLGRSLRARVAAAGVDVGGVVLRPPSSGLVFVEGLGASRDVLPFREVEAPIVAPAAWTSQVLLLSGLSPVVSYGATLCKAARAARRTGTTVVLDVLAQRYAWVGRDPRTIRMLLREVDVVRCTSDDLFALDVALEEIRGELRPSAVLVASNGAGSVWASGPFGEVARARPPRSKVATPPTSFDSLPSAICTELALGGLDANPGPDVWERVLARAEKAAPPAE